jgi:hypothetical protein
MSDLRTRAELAKLAKDATESSGIPFRVETPTASEPTAAPDLTESGVPADPAATVYEAWSRVMADVQWIGKGTSRGLKYEFRGIDAVLNAVGPALRKHGVTVVQTGVETTYETMKTTGGSSMRLCVARVSYAVFGPTGDRIDAPLMSVGEAFDSGDKATPKALSVALRTFYINSLAIPTNQPTLDPEYGVQHEIAAPAPPTADEYAAEIERERTSIDRLRAIRRELAAHPGIGETVVSTLGGEDLTLNELLSRVGRQRTAAQSS